MGRGGIEMGIEMGTKSRDEATIDPWMVYRVQPRRTVAGHWNKNLWVNVDESGNTSPLVSCPFSDFMGFCCDLSLSLFFWIKFHAPLETLEEDNYYYFSIDIFFNPSLEKHFYRSLGNFDYMRINIILWRISGQKLGEGFAEICTSRQ